MTSNATSFFNQGVYQIERLNTAWARCNYYSRKGHLDSWRWTLDSIHRELGADINRMRSENNQEVAGHDDEINSINHYLIKAFRGGNKYYIYKLLNRKEELLRIIEDLTGKGAKIVEDDDSDYY